MWDGGCGVGCVGKIDEDWMCVMGMVCDGGLGDGRLMSDGGLDV